MSCPESISSDDHSDNITIPVKWISPVKSPKISGVDFVLLRSVCLQNSTIQEVYMYIMFVDILFSYSSTVFMFVGCAACWSSLWGWG